MAVLIEVTGLVTRMVVVLARLFRDRLVAMPMLIEVTRPVAWMVVVSAWLSTAVGFQAIVAE